MVGLGDVLEKFGEKLSESVCEHAWSIFEGVGDNLGGHVEASIQTRTEYKQMHSNIVLYLSSLVLSHIKQYPHTEIVVAFVRR